MSYACRSGKSAERDSHSFIPFLQRLQKASDLQKIREYPVPGLVKKQQKPLVSK
jgi:hypothetical protein